MTNRGPRSHLRWNYFRPPATRCINDLVTMCLHYALQHESPATIRQYLQRIDQLPEDVDDALKQAEDNTLVTYDHFRTCRCGRKFVVARAEWVEFWVGANGEVIPFKTQVCSWHCAEVFYYPEVLAQN